MSNNTHLHILFSGILLFVLSINTVTAQSKYVKIPDAKFVSYLKEKIPTAFKGDRMDINSEEVKTLSRINVINKKITDFTGIEYFVALEEFNCTYNLAETLDLSKNKKLKSFVCWENRLTSLDVSGNPELMILNCGDNQISSLNISKNQKLKELYCEYNDLKDLDISNNPDLEVMYCAANQLISLDLSQNPKLERLIVAENPLEQVSKTSILAEIPDANFRKVLKEMIPNAFVGDFLNTKHNDVLFLQGLNVSNANIKSLQGIAYFKGLAHLDCSGNNLTSLDISQNSKVTAFKFDGNPLETLDMRGVRFIDDITDLATMTSLKELKVHRNTRDLQGIMQLKNQRGAAIKISVYGARPESHSYILINSNDQPNPSDNKYRNNS
ncbi:hypothetical protein GUA46_11905 [Muricauda sp. HICW]|uniref:Leucine-rich repeat domain-containing protein n=1 Tax=Flagellimonas chongwuensis TaxID=2697365 RepID=A0A850NNY6_9FLAO|nr:hypothetical protein [Allomuricauda chongwuensis]NVN19047.1 hypothetical protein [Allomuricauda chongwuensis]